MTILVKETTVWADPCQNHFYLLTDCKTYCLGYITERTKEERMFKKRMRFDTRGRTFQTIKKFAD